MLATYLPTNNQNTETTGIPQIPEISVPNRLLNDINSINIVEDNIKDTFISKSWSIAKRDISRSENVRTLVQLADINLLRGAYNRAIGAYQKALSLNPKLLSVYPKLIQALLIQGNITEVESYYNELLKLSNRKPQFVHGYILFKLFSIPLSDEQIDQLLKDLKVAMDDAPEDFEILNTYGFILLNVKRNTEEAKQYFKRSLKINDKYIHALNNLGVCYFNEKNYKKADLFYDQALLIDPTFNLPYENKANLFVTEGNFQKALDILIAAIDKGVNISNHWLDKIGNIYYLQGDFLKSIKWFQLRLQENPNNYSALNDLGVNYCTLKDYDKGLFYFLKALDIFKAMPNQQTSLHAVLNIGKLGMIKGDVHLLKKAANILLDINIHDSFALYLDGLSELLLKNYEKAKKRLEEVIKIDEKMIPAYGDLGFIYMCINKDYKKTIQFLSDIKQKYSIKELTIDNNLAYAYLKTGDLKKAEKILSQYDKVDNGTLLATIGLLKIKEGKLKKGLSYYDNAFDRLAGDKEKLRVAKQSLNFELANYYLEHKDKQKAQNYLKEAEKLGNSYLTTDIISLKQLL